MTKIDFDELPYQVKIEMIAHWELHQEVEEYYNQKAIKEAKDRM